MKKKKYIVLGILITLIITIGISFALWITNLSQTGMNKISSSCFSLELVNEANDINLQKAYPVTDEQGMRTEPFKFTIKNTCDVFASYTVSLEVLDGTDLKTSYVKSQINREEPANLSTLETTDTTIANSVESRILARGSLGSDDEEDYTVRLWMDESVTLADTDSMNKSFLAKIIITGQPSTYSPVEQGITKLSEAMLANEYQTSVEVAKNKIAAKNTPDFSKTAPIIEWQEVHETNETTVNADKPHPSLNGNETLGGQNLAEDSQKLILGKSYTFNKENGQYSLQDRITIDPTALTDYSTQNYYYCSAGTNVGSTGVISTFNNYSGCTYIYKVNSVTASDYGTPNTNGYRRRYTMKANTLRQTELESDKSDKGIYQTEDDLGTSYYYRGNVRNNFVKFAGYYWRIIRRNGDGTVRLIYNGPNTSQTGSSTQIQGLAFNAQRDNPAYVGYMYGNTLNTSKEQTQANEINSNMKTFLENWYEDHLSRYDTYIADEIFCNDRSITSGNGYATNTISFYGAYNRLVQKKEPTLKCPQTSDKFTVSETLGNGKNMHPIGLITADELSMAGAVNGSLNRLFYLYTGNYYWSMSPYDFYSGDAAAYEWHFSSAGYFSTDWVTSGDGVRAIINLRTDVEITGGIGTANDPFVVKETV